ncbi:MAG: hypothetical protein IJU65_05580, partial [Desulfovibrio sp.]|nr:hypothetical protein [Desulfovibrio sp.]
KYQLQQPEQAATHPGKNEADECCRKAKHLQQCDVKNGLKNCRESGSKQCNKIDLPKAKFCRQIVLHISCQNILT